MQSDVSDTPAIRVRFVMPEPDLAPYISTFYRMDVGDVGDGGLTDWLHPEWGNLRFCQFDRIEAGIGEQPVRPVPACVVTGPTSMCTKFRVSKGLSWGIGLLPLGWARLLEAGAAKYRDHFCDAEQDPALRNLAEVGAGLFDPGIDVHAQAAMLQTRVRALLKRPSRLKEGRIAKVNAALVDPSVSSVAQFADHIAMSSRTLERLCNRAFGFPPKLLLRRQRFLGSLARYMMDPSLSWISSLDDGYHDQAHFVHDFHRFMTMSPSAYSKLDHPILMAAMRGRVEAAGQAMQALHEPAAG